MSGRRFSTEKYAGANVAFPTGIADRLVDVARAELAAQLRFVDDDEDPAHVIEAWLVGKQTIPMPGPHAEPGDLLVKTARAETWTFTVHGWRELAPLELQTDPAGAVNAAFAEGDRYWGKSVVEGELDRIRAEKWEPDEQQQQILDALRAKEHEYGQAADALKPVHMGGKDGHLRELEQRRRGIGEARYLVAAEMRRLHGQGSS